MEYRDIYNENRKLTGKVVQHGETIENAEYPLVVIAFIKKKSDFLISKRVATKKVFPNTWEQPGSTAIRGETSEMEVLQKKKS